MTLRIYTETLELIRGSRDVMTKVAQSDPDLGRQMRKALTSIPLNIAEGEWRRDGHARARFGTAMGSANEVKACLETAEAFGYIEAQPERIDTLDRIARTLSKLIR